MNTVIRSLTHVVMIAATLATSIAVQAADVSGAAPKVVRLDTVYITGKRIVAEPIPVAQLPTVTVVGKRLIVEPVRVVQLPTVYVTGSRSVEGALLAKVERTAAL